MGRRKARDKRLLVANDMPPLYCKKPGCPYSFKSDEVLTWISQRPGLLSYTLDKLRMGGYIVYNPEKGTWQGVDYGT